MFCKHCGSQIEDSAKFCHTCGKIVEREEYVASGNATPNYFETPAPNYYNNPAPSNFNNGYNPPVQKESGGGILTFAILGLAFGCTLILSFLGIIFSAISRGKANNYIVRYGKLDGPGIAGNGIGKAGLIVSIIMKNSYVFLNKKCSEEKPRR